MPPKSSSVSGQKKTSNNNSFTSGGKGNGDDTQSVTDSVAESTNTSVVASKPTTASEQKDFGIVVAVRVRPFNKKELSEGNVSLSNTQQQQHMGGTSGSTASHNPLGKRTDNGDSNTAPVVEMETDLHTLTLLDPTRDYSERAKFQFDHIFSAFRPAVEIMGVMSPNKRRDSMSSAAALSDSDSESEEATAERAQFEIYSTIGLPIVKSAWDGYNACIFAYGQTSSGKTYTMMGTKRDPGIIPRLCRQLFERIEEEELRQAQQQQQYLSAMEQRPVSSSPQEAGSSTSPTTTSATPQPRSTTDGSSPQLLNMAAPPRRLIKCSVSYMEIYNEQVKDLLKQRPKGAKPKFSSRFEAKQVDDEDYQNLRVRYHPLQGPFVEGITKVEVDNWLECVKIIRQGNEFRSTTATDMNDSSSRSHAIFQLVLTQTEALGARVRGKEVTNHKVSKINLVDLAGSERITRTNVTGKHVAEANYINQSLSTLRKVIDALVAKRKPGQTVVIPYRESMLTWILSDNFGGNSKTVMMANVSPHCSNFLETESTLRYATLARGIINRIRVNEDPSAKLIRELQAQLKHLQEEMTRGPQQGRVRELEEQMEENKKAMDELHAREEGMRQLIQESRLREEKLLTEKEAVAKNEEKWRNEAEKLRREKDQLRQALSEIAAKNPELLVSKNKTDFWLLREDSGEGGGSATAKSGGATTLHAVQHGGSSGGDTSNAWLNPNDDDTSCPPQQGLTRRRSSQRFGGLRHQQQHQQGSQLVSNTPGVVSPPHLIASGPSSSVDPPRAPLPPTNTVEASKGSKMVADVGPTSLPIKAPTNTVNAVSSVAPTPGLAGVDVGQVPKFGRRAITEEGKDRGKGGATTSSGSSSLPGREEVHSAQSDNTSNKGDIPVSVYAPPLKGRRGAPLPVEAFSETNLSVDVSAKSSTRPSMDGKPIMEAGSAKSTSPPPPLPPAGGGAQKKVSAEPDALDSFLNNTNPESLGAANAQQGSSSSTTSKPVPAWRVKKVAA